MTHRYDPTCVCEKCSLHPFHGPSIFNPWAVEIRSPQEVAMRVDNPRPLRTQPVYDAIQAAVAREHGLNRERVLTSGESFSREFARRRDELETQLNKFIRERYGVGHGSSDIGYCRDVTIKPQRA